MADGKVVIETGLDSSGIEKDISKLGSLASTGLKATTAAITAASGALTAFAGYSVKAGSSFEAGMSEVEAISGATGEQIEELAAKAKEMGATTKFSATESAAALKYMAMAGWSTEDMLGGLEGIMNLAAASGEDLASVSDIVTDALTAFGLQASDSGHFADVLAKAASSSNTNVGLMGATFQYVAPLAGALGYSIEDTAVAIGLMANAGIKGEKAGTALRSMFTRLSDPPADAAAAIDELRLSMTNADGTMRPLSDVMADLRTKFAGLSEEQKVQMASSLAGQEAMSGLLAIVNASDEDFEKLTESINNASGAAEEMAGVMNDNLKGDITLLQSAVEGLGIQVYESVDVELREAVQAGIGYVDQLSGAFTDGGLKGAVKEAGTIFADMATEATKQAPKMAKSAIQFIKAFTKGISANKKEIWDSAVEIAKALADGLADLLPKSVKKPVKEAIDTISKSLTSGGLKNAVSTTVTIFKNLATAAGDVLGPSLKIAAELIDVLADHMDILIPILATGAAAFGAYKVINTISPMINGMTTAFKAASTAMEGYGAVEAWVTTLGYDMGAQMTLGRAIIGFFHGEVSLATVKMQLATAATTAWNAVLSTLGGPLGVAVTAIAALTVGVLAYKATQEETVSETETWIDKNEELMESISDTNESIQSNIDQRQKAYDCSVTEAGAIDILTQRLSELSDKENKSTEDKAAMAAIVDELNEKIPTLGLVIDEETGYLNMNEEAILAVTQANKDMIMAKAAQESLIPISQSIYEAEMNLAEATEKSAEAYEAYKSAQEKATIEGQRYIEMAENGQISNVEAKRKIEELNQEVSDTKSVYDEWSTKVDECSQTLDDANAKYEFMEGKVAEYSAAVNSAKVSVDEMGASEQLLAAVHSESSDEIQQALNTVSEGFVTATNANKEQLEQQVTDLEANAEMMKAALQEGMPGVTQEMVDQCNQMVFNAKAELDKLSPNLKSSVDNAGRTVVSTSESYSKPFYNATNKISESGKQGFDAADMPGYLGMRAREGGNNAAADLASTASLNHEAGRRVASSEKSGYDSADVTGYFSESGSDAGMAKADALESTSGANEAAGASVGEAANSGVDSSDMEGHFKDTANRAVSGFIKAIDAMVGTARAAGQEIGDNSTEGLRASSSGSYSLGADFASGYANGIWGGISAAVSAAASMAAQAIAAVKATQDSASPSKKTRKLAHDFGDGYAYGILDKEDEVEAAAEDISETALGALDFSGIDISGMAEKMKQAVANENHIFGTNLSSEFVNKIYKNVELENKQEGINYEKMAAYIVSAFIRAGVTIEVDKRPFGRIVGEIVGT